MVKNCGNRDDVQKIILALLISRKESTSLQLLAKDYLEQEGECIPWKELGYASLLDYLKSMPNCVSLEKKDDIYYARGIASNKSKHISLLVARQKTQSKVRSCLRKYRPNHYYPKTSSPRIHIPADILSDLILIIKQSPNGINKDYALKWLHNKLPNLNLSITDLEKQVRDLSHKIYIDGHRIFPLKKMPISDQLRSKSLSKIENENLWFKDSVESKYFVSGDTESEKESDDDVLKKFRKSDSKDNKNQISNKKQSISTFIQETVSKCHKKGHTQHYSSESNITLDTSLQKLHEEDITFFDKKNIKLLISDRKRYQLEKLIQKYPNGIWCADLPKKYQEEYNVSLSYNELGFSSVREFASYLPEIFQCRKLPQSEDFILYDAKMELTDINKIILPNKVGLYTQSYLVEDEADALPVVLSNDTSNKLIPEDVMALGESVGQIYVKDIQNRPQQYIEVFVEEVFTPSLFWVQLRKEKRYLKKMMDILHIFYEENYLNYKIPIVVLEKGLNCACKYDNIWHRGIIKSVRYDLHVTIMFYDYGTLKTYPPEEIFYLHRAFSYLPAQAIPCGLYNVKPSIGEKWSRGVTQEFADKTYLKPLIATIVSTDPENNSMLITLTDTEEEEDVHINDWMVHQNLAVHGKMVRIRPRNFPFYYYLKSKGINKTNCEDLSNSILDISRTKETSVINILKNVYKSPLSASLQNHCKSDNISNTSKNCGQYLQRSNNNFIQSSHSKASTRSDDQLQILKNNKKCFSDVEVLSSPSEKSELVSNITRFTMGNQDSTKMKYLEKNEFKTGLEETIGSNYISSSTQSEEQENCDIKMNLKNVIESDDIEICIQQEKQERKDIPLPKRYFTNALNCSLNLQSKYQDYDTSPDDNIATTIDCSKLISNYNNYIDLQNIKIGVPEIILSALRIDKSEVNDQFSVNTKQNINDSLNQVEQRTTSKSNISSKLINEKNSSGKIEINQESDDACKTSKTLIQIKSNEDTKLNFDDYCNSENCDNNNNNNNDNNNNNNETKKDVLDIRTNEEKFNSILRKNVNENNLMKITSRLRSLLKIKNFYSECTELHKFTKEVISLSNDNNLQCDSNEWNIENNTGNTILSNFKINQIVKNDQLVQIMETNCNKQKNESYKNQREENLDNANDNVTNITNNKISSNSKKNPFLQAIHKYANCIDTLSNKLIYEKTDEPVIKTFNDNNLEDDNDECNIESKINDYYGKENDNEQEQIAELNDNKSLEEERNYNNDDCKDNLESQISEIEMIEDVQHISSSDIDCLKNSDTINKIEKNNEQAIEPTMPLIQSGVIKQKDVLNEHQREEHINNVSDIAKHITDNKFLSNSKKSDKLEISYEGIIETDDKDLQYDSDDKWSIVGNLDDFILGKVILSNLSVNPIINNAGNDCKSLNMMEDKNYNNHDCKDNLKLKISDIKNEND